MKTIVIDVEKPTASPRFLGMMTLIFAAMSLPMSAWMVWIWLTPPVPASAPLVPRVVLLVFAAMFLTPVALPMFYLGRAIRRTSGPQASLMTAASDRSDAVLCSALLVMSASSKHGVGTLKRSGIDELERRIGRRLPRLWVVGSDLAQALTDTPGKMTDTDESMFRVKARPRPAHIVWCVVLLVVWAIAGMALLRLWRSGWDEVVVYGALAVGSVGWAIWFRKAGWWCFVDEGEAEIVLFDARERILTRRRLDDPDPLVIVTRDRQTRSGTLLALEPSLRWTLILSTGERIEIEDMPAGVSPWLAFTRETEPAREGPSPAPR